MHKGAVEIELDDSDRLRALLFGRKQTAPQTLLYPQPVVALQQVHQSQSPMLAPMMALMLVAVLAAAAQAEVAMASGQRPTPLQHRCL